MIANQVTINPEREARYLFSTPYTYSHGVIVTASDNDDITTLGDLKGRTTAQTASSNWAQVAKDAGAKVEYVQDFGPGVELLVQGRVDAIVNDNIAVLDYLATSGTDEVKIAGDAGDEILEQALTFRKSDADLQRAGRRRDQDAHRRRHPREDLRRATSAPTSRSRAAQGRRRQGLGLADDLGGPAGHRRGRCARACSRATIPLTIASFLSGWCIAVAAALARLSSIRASTGSPGSTSRSSAAPRCWCSCSSSSSACRRSASTSTRTRRACLALSLNVGGYAAEIVRAAILSVPRGQYEAATDDRHGLLAVDAAHRPPAGRAHRRTAAVQHPALAGQGHLARLARAGPRAVPRGHR